jgi:hypothetical protein
MVCDCDGVGFLSGRPDEMRDALVHGAPYSFHCICCGPGFVATGPSTGNTATSTAGTVPASRTLESHNTMQRQHAFSTFPKVYCMSLASNCSLPYVFSNSFHPRISTGHQGMHMYLVWLLVFCFVLGGVVILVCWADLALGRLGLEPPLSPLNVRSPS